MTSCDQRSKLRFILKILIFGPFWRHFGHFFGQLGELGCKTSHKLFLSSECPKNRKRIKIYFSVSFPSYSINSVKNKIFAQLASAYNKIWKLSWVRLSVRHQIHEDSLTKREKCVHYCRQSPPYTADFSRIVHGIYVAASELLKGNSGH